MVAAMIGWVAKEQWHTGWTGAATKNLMGDDVAGVVEPADELNKDVRKMSGDVEAAVSAHWRKLLASIKSGGDKLTLVKQGEGVKPVDRLAGV
jgi:hypothetical protein